MGTGIISKVFAWKKTLLILIVVFSVFIIYYTIMIMMSPAKKLAEIQNELAPKSDEISDTDKKIKSDSAYLALLKEKAFLQSRIVMAETDSIYLTINLKDSTSNIEISGVVVHKAKMAEIKASRIFLKGDEYLISSMLASPFIISDAISTIRKEPVMIKMAPKDTSEYKPDVLPDTSLTEPVYYILRMTNGTRIYVYQAEEDNFSDRMNTFFFDFKDHLRNTWNSLKRVALLKVPEYHPYVKMKLPRADAKIIYRAIPVNGQVCIYR